VAAGGTAVGGGIVGATGAAVAGLAGADGLGAEVAGAAGEGFGAGTVLGEHPYAADIPRRKARRRVAFMMESSARDSKGSIVIAGSPDCTRAAGRPLGSPAEP